jgi:hypothetical protein
VSVVKQVIYFGTEGVLFIVNITVYSKFKLLIYCIHKTNGEYILCNVLNSSTN